MAIKTTGTKKQIAEANRIVSRLQELSDLTDRLHKLAKGWGSNSEAEARIGLDLDHLEKAWCKNGEGESQPETQDGEPSSGE